jgi:hypothetical protein
VGLGTHLDVGRNKRLHGLDELEVGGACSKVHQVHVARIEIGGCMRNQEAGLQGEEGPKGRNQRSGDSLDSAHLQRS